MLVETIPVGVLETNCYLASVNKDEVVVIDPGDDAELIKSTIGDRKVLAVLLTHGHYDHTGALYAFADVPIYIHPQDQIMLEDGYFSFGSQAGDSEPRPKATHSMVEGQLVSIGGMDFQVLHTPGHTLGSVCLRHGDIIFTGDTLFKGDYGRTDLPGGSMEQMRASLRRLFSLSGCRIYPGHGPDDVIK